MSFHEEALRVRAPHRLQLGDGQARCPVVVLVHDDRRCRRWRPGSDGTRCPSRRTPPSSSSLIGRDASDRSVSPLQNFLKPPPVPEMPTVTWTPGLAAPKASAAAVVSGPTVEEPSAEMVPDRFESAAAAVEAGAAAVSVPLAAGAAAAVVVSSSRLQPPHAASTRPSGSRRRSPRSCACACVFLHRVPPVGGSSAAGPKWAARWIPAGEEPVRRIRARELPAPRR